MICLKAIIAKPPKKNSSNLIEIQKPKPTGKQVLFRVVRLGVDGTDREINEGLYGEPPEGSDYLILGHEALGRIEELGPDVAGFTQGQTVVPTVRRPDDCLNCANGESDMCLKGNYKEHGIYKLHGFASEYAISDADFLVKIPKGLEDVAVLLEPLSIAEKAIYQIRKIQERMVWEPRNALVLGAGTLGLLATLLLRVQGLDVSTVATRPKDSLKAKIVDWAGGHYINAKETAPNKQFDIILEATGSTQVAIDSLKLMGTNATMCFLGVYSSKIISQDFGNLLRTVVLGNRLFFGSVNANRKYFELGLQHMAEMRSRFAGVLEKLMTSTLKPEEYPRAFEPSRDEIKTVIQFS